MRKARPRGRGRTGSQWRRCVTLTRARAAAGEPCARCGQPIDLDLDVNDQWSYTTGHKPGFGKADLAYDDPRLDDPANCQPEHRSCNSSAGATRPRLLVTSEDW